ncbi:MAG: DNA primase [Candidatus Cloacimonetes bacterium]|nr:DNA primase [Candidatus Cloacimonadota bacterium]
MEHSQIDRILEMNNIVDVVSSYFPLKKSGSNYKARCPFHDEKTASFVVSEKKQIYKCFGCGKGGNAITFVRDYEKISFGEALRMLAIRAGISLKEVKVDQKKQSRKELIYTVYTLATSFFKESRKKFGNEANTYLSKRQLSQKTIEKFEIGFALDSFGGLKNHLLKNNINSQILEKTGLFSSNDNGIYDVFRNRLMFPIHSVTGKVIAFGGRILRENQGGGKYINSPTTEIYTKGNELYGLFITRYEISKKDQVIVSEGYLDFLRLFENGFKNSVASLGTSLTDSQINLLSRYSNNFVILYDGDDAGQKAAVRAAGNVIKKGFSVRLVSLPKDEDPDSFIMKYGTEELQQLIDEAKKLPVFLLEDERSGLEKKAKLNLLIEILNETEDEISRELFIKEIAETFEISEHAISSKVRINRKKKTKTLNPSSDLQKYPEEKNLLKIILNDKSLYKKVAKQVDSDYFLSKNYRDIFVQISKNIEKLNSVSGLFEYVEDELSKKILADLIIEKTSEVSLEDILLEIKLRKYKKDQQTIKEKIHNNPFDKELLKEKYEIKQKIIGIDKKVVTKTLY